MLPNVWSDVRYAMRTFRRNPGFAAAAIVPIALGIGINTGIFTILDRIALRPLTVPEATELVSIHQQFQGVRQRRVSGSRSMFSMPEYRMYRDGTQTLSGVTAYATSRTVTLGGDSPQDIEGVMVACNYFDVLQRRPAIGPGFTAANCDAPDAPAAVVLSHDLWTRTFAADPAIVQKTVTLNRQPFAVVGVAPEGFHGTDVVKAAFFAPVSTQAALRPDQDFYDDASVSWLSLLGRRKHEAGIAQVRAELGVIARQIDQQEPGRTTTLTVVQATSLSLPEARQGILTVAVVVLAAFGLVLLIACANVANLLLARAASRTKEIAVRLSVGASRGRLIQQLLTESLIIALAGGVAGSVLAWWSFQALLTLILSALPGQIPPLNIDAQPNLRVLWFALALTTTTALVFGLAPALHASKQDLQTVLKQDGAGSGRRTSGWLRGVLVGVQVAMCMVLLISAGLLLRGLYAAQTIDPGFDFRNVAVVSFNLRGPEYDERKTASFQSQLMERIASLPGVEAVAQVDRTPLSPGRTTSMFHLPGQPEQGRQIDTNVVSPGYFSLIAIPVVRGRTFQPEELTDPSRAVIVTEATARRYWPGRDPIGQTLIMRVGRDREAPLQVVGVTKDAQIARIAETEASYLYLPATPRAQARLSLIVRSTADFAALAAAIRATIRELDPGLMVRVNPLEENLDFWRTMSRLVAGLSGSLSLLALVLASVGVYGVVSYVVSRRLREVGIRMMLGATARDVHALILRQMLRPVAIGVVIGIGAAAAASQMLTSVLFGISRFDPIAFVGAPLFLVGVAAVAGLIPARRATRVDPMVTLRYE